ncbi:hypothetical protein EMO89_00345 [Bifidobacterium tissieri]|uniref:Uncharacterized protein n=1 Tax=Bifidobacterium tissieri TaxID=1630162 RepID=A0A5M9ZXL9_9BIFI|nr:hypothetical protein [Bifidobacterium tissieri]KAA8832013.1 hypothetical protein EMO89_00345 [Bifidobacterium tissieri]
MGKKARLRRQRQQRMMGEARGGVRGSASDARSLFEGNASGPVSCIVESVRPDGSVEPKGMLNVDSVDAVVQATLLRRARPRELGLGRVGEAIMHGHEADWWDVDRSYRCLCLTSSLMHMKNHMNSLMRLRGAEWASSVTDDELEDCAGIMYGAFLRWTLLNTARTLNGEEPIDMEVPLDAGSGCIKRADELMRSGLERLGLDEYADILDLPAPTIEASRRDADRTIRRAKGGDDETGEFLRAYDRGPAYAEKWYRAHHLCA